MDEFDDIAPEMTNNPSEIEDYEVPEPVDFWSLDDFDDVLA